jgi:hypothetical protein
VACNQTDGSCLVVWEDTRNQSARGYDIYGRAVQSDAALAGPDLLLTGPGATDNESAPAVAGNQADGGYLIAWEDWRNNATRKADIYGRLFAG